MLNEKIIIVEDSDIERRFIQEVLKHLGHTDVLFLENGQQLLNYILRKEEYTDKEKYPEPRLILLDLHMPIKNGKEVLKELHKINPKLLSERVIIIFTGSIEEEDIIFCYEMGAKSYVVKPSSLDGYKKLIQKIKSYWIETNIHPM